LLKELNTKIAPILTIIFQRSLDIGIVHKDWKHAIIIPALKKGQIKLMKGKALRKHSLHEKNSSLGFIEAVHQ